MPPFFPIDRPDSPPDAPVVSHPAATRPRPGADRYRSWQRLALAARGWIFPLTTVFLAACASQSPEPETNTRGTKPELVGRVASLSPDGRFVLVQSYGPWRVEPGSTLTTRGPEGRTANLLVTGEKLGQYAAADIRSGALASGDAVYFLPPPATTRRGTAEDDPAPDASPASADPDPQGGPSGIGTGIPEAPARSETSDDPDEFGT